MKNNQGIIVGLIIMTVITVGLIFLSMAITKSIVNADIPEWLKFWLMRI